MAFLAGFVALRTGQPSGHYMIRSAFAIFLRHTLERFASSVELTKTQCGRREIQLTRGVAGTQARNLGAPNYRFGAILLLGGFSENFAGGERIMINLKGLFCGGVCGIKITLFQRRLGLPEPA